MSIEVDVRHEFPGFSLEVKFSAPQGVTALFGRSGSGKTTIVNAVSGLLRPDTGRVVVNGSALLDTDSRICLPTHQRRIGYVFQEGRLFPHLTVEQNLRFGRWFTPRGIRPRDGHEMTRIVTLLGIDHLLDRRPASLSGGEKQRVAIGRALLSTPNLLLMDEPLAALDEARKEEILPYLERLRDETKIPILYVSHSIAEVARLATTVVVLENGKMVRIGPAAAVLADPGTVPLVGVRDAGAVLSARVMKRDVGDGLAELAVSGGRLHLPGITAPEGALMRLRIRAHEIILATEKPGNMSALNVLPATVTEVREGEGPGAAVGLICGEDRLLARITRRSVHVLGLEPGKPVFAILKSTAVARQDIGTFEERPLL